MVVSAPNGREGTGSATPECRPNRAPGWLSKGSILFWMGLVGPAVAAQSVELVSQPSLRLTGAVGTPGQLVQLHLQFSDPQRRAFRGLSLDVDFPQELTFIGVDLAYRLERMNARAVARLYQDGQRLALEFSLPDEAENQLSGGSLAYLNFQLSEEAEPKVLTVSAAAARFETEGTPVELTEPVEAHVNVMGGEEQIPLISCFFYMH